MTSVGALGADWLGEADVLGEDWPDEDVLPDGVVWLGEALAAVGGVLAGAALDCSSGLVPGVSSVCGLGNCTGRITPVL